MSTADLPAAPASLATTSEAKKKKKSRSEKRAAAAKANPHERIKTVVRRLPPNLPEEIFWQSVQKWVSDETVVWKSYMQGKLRKKMNKENVHSRAYIAFKNEDLVAEFSREYDGHVFRDKAGNEAQAVVEFAPFQKIPAPEKVKKDHRIDTIEEDEEYQAFLKTLEESTTKTMDTETLLETLIASTVAAPQPTSTPLLEALKAEKSAQKDKEAILRNHAHYKEIKKDDKKKGAAGAAASTAPPVAPADVAAGKDAPSTLGKRAAKKAAAAQKAAAAAEKEKGKEKATPTPSGSGTAPKPAPPTPKKKGAAAAPVSAAPPGADVTTPIDTPAPAPASGAEPGPKRQRPVIAASSRALEAALSGAGVQKKREPREKGKEKEKDGAALDASDAKGKSRPPTSGKVPASIAVPPAAGGSGGGVLPAPAILQREQAPKIVARPTEAAAAVPAASPAAEGGAAPPGRGGKRGGRGGGGARGGGRGGGRGRGRGGPPAVQGD